jgi:hypothetical protein
MTEEKFEEEMKKLEMTEEKCEMKKLKMTK